MEGEILTSDTARSSAPIDYDKARHPLTIADAVELFAQLGTPRSKRLVQQFCKQEHLDCVRTKGPRAEHLSVYLIRHLQSFGSGRHSRRSLMARRRPRVNQESLPRASLAGWRSGRFFRQERDCWRGPTCRWRPPNRGREP